MQQQLYYGNKIIWKRSQVNLSLNIVHGKCASDVQELKMFTTYFVSLLNRSTHSFHYFLGFFCFTFSVGFNEFWVIFIHPKYYRYAIEGLNLNSNNGNNKLWNFFLFVGWGLKCTIKLVSIQRSNLFYCDEIKKTA